MRRLVLRDPFPTHRLRPLTVDQSAEYLARRIGAAPEPSVLAELWRATGGNPAAMLSACSYLSDEQLHGLVPFPDPVPIGPELVAAYGQWVEGLDADAAAATTIAATALMSRPVLQDALAQVDLGFEALDQVIEMKAISILGDRVEFMHPLTRAAAFQQATSRLKVERAAGRRARLRASWAHRTGGPPGGPLDDPARRRHRRHVPASLPTRPRARRRGRGRPVRGARCPLRPGSRARGTPPHPRRFALHAAGRPDRAMECLRRVTPVNSSASIVGHATYRAGRIAFATEGAPHSAAEMAAGAEASTADSPRGRGGHVGGRGGQRSLHGSHGGGCPPRVSSGTGRRIGTVCRSRPGPRDRTVDRTQHIHAGGGGDRQDSLVRLLNASTPFVGSPQLAYVIGSAVVQSAPPVLVRRWFGFMNGPASSAQHGLLGGAVTMVRAKELLSSGRVVGRAFRRRGRSDPVRRAA